MPMQVRKGGAWRTITAAKIFAGGAWRPLVSIKIFAGGAWRTVANFTAPAPPPPTTPPTTPPPTGGGGTITLTISPSPFTAFSTGSAVSKSLTATPSGGLAPYTYAWTVVTSSVPITFSAATSATTSATATVVVGHTETATLRCTATDSLGTVAHADVSGTFENGTL